jgi:hypothetical protein
MRNIQAFPHEVDTRVKYELSMNSNINTNWKA